MKQAQQLLEDFHTVKRHSCLSEWESWIRDVIAYLEMCAMADKVIEGGLVKTKAVDPTIQNQLDLPLEALPKRGDIRFQLLED